MSNVFNIQKTENSVHIDINTEGIDQNALIHVLRRIQTEFLAHKVNFSDELLDLGDEIKADWWAKNKKRLLGDA